MADSAAPPAVVELVTGLGVGGAERAVMGLAQGLQDVGWLPVVVAVSREQGILRQYADTQVPVHTLGISRNPLTLARGVWKLARIVREHRVSILHAHLFHSLVVAMMCTALIPSVKIVFTSHSYGGFSRKRTLLLRCTKRLRAADIVFGPDQHPTLNARLTRIIPNGVRSQSVGSERGSPGFGRPAIFLFVGRLEPLKNPLAVVAAFAALKRPDTELWLVGEGRLAPEVVELAAELHVGSRVKLLGVQDNITGLLGQAHCLVMASAWEGLPLSLLEAGAAGIPVVAPPVGAISSLFEDDCGLLAVPEDLTEALETVLDDYPAALRRATRLRCRIMRSYSEEAVVHQHARLYWEVIGLDCI